MREGSNRLHIQKSICSKEIDKEAIFIYFYSLAGALKDGERYTTWALVQKGQQYFDLLGHVRKLSEIPVEDMIIMCDFGLDGNVTLYTAVSEMIEKDIVVGGNYKVISGVSWSYAIPLGSNTYKVLVPTVLLSCEKTVVVPPQFLWTVNGKLIM